MLQSFADVPITDLGVATISFLEAAEGLVGIFGKSLSKLLCRNALKVCNLQICSDLLLSLSFRLILEAT